MSYWFEMISEKFPKCKKWFELQDNFRPSLPEEFTVHIMFGTVILFVVVYFRVAQKFGTFLYAL